MVLILPSETRINLRQVCTYAYRQGKLCFHLSSGPTLEESMDVDKAAKLLVAIDKALDGPYFVNPPVKEKKDEPKSRMAAQSAKRKLAECADTEDRAMGCAGLGAS